MRILYSALDQPIPGTKGGSVHVRAVAEGLAALGHDVHAAVTQTGPWPNSSSGVTWHALPPPLGRSQLRWLRASALSQIGREMRAQVVMERYYNFGGEGVTAARRLGVPAALEVNAPIIDYPGSPKAILDRALLVRPFARWRERICRDTRLFITPSADILPSSVDRARVLVTEWGADTDRFHPRTTEMNPPEVLRALSGRIVCVFAGAFRAWHGAIHLARSLARLHASGDQRFGGLFIGDGPEREAVERAAAGVPAVVFTGAVAHDAMPAHLAAADIGVAPFDPSKHPDLQLGFYWSPLKIFEYMSSGLPVVAPAIPRLQQLVGHDREGLLYDPGAPEALDHAIRALADEALRRRIGTAARTRAVSEYSWTTHVAAVDARLRALVSP